MVYEGVIILLSGAYILYCCIHFNRDMAWFLLGDSDYFWDRVCVCVTKGRHAHSYTFRFRKTNGFKSVSYLGV